MGVGAYRGAQKKPSWVDCKRVGGEGVTEEEENKKAQMVAILL